MFIMSIVLFVAVAALAIVGLYTLVDAALEAAEKLAENRKVKASVRAYQSRIAKINAMPEEDQREARIRRELSPICVVVNGVRVPLKVRFTTDTEYPVPDEYTRQCHDAGLIPGMLYDIDYLDIGSRGTEFAIRGIKGEVFNSLTFDFLVEGEVIKPWEYDKYNLNGYVTCAQPLSDKVQRLWEEVAARREAYAAAIGLPMT